MAGGESENGFLIGNVVGGLGVLGGLCGWLQNYLCRSV